MEEPYKGPERRRPNPEDEYREGRRRGDIHCPQHAILWEHHEKDKDEFRKLSCGKIAKIEKELSAEVCKLENADKNISDRIDDLGKAIVGKYWFRVVIGGLCFAIIWIANQNRMSNVEQVESLKELITSQKSISSTVNNIENKQIESSMEIKAFRSELESLNKRQDFLRDLINRRDGVNKQQ
jgi:hypothetical protein